VAIPSYSLSPHVSVMEITNEMQQFLAALWRKTGKRPLVTGQSAGGHLTAEMMARAWSGFPGVPGDLVTAGYAISGVFDLAPLIGTSLNDALALTKGTARLASPLFRPPAAPRGRQLVAAVGGGESGEFLRQSRDMAEAWGKAGVEATCEVIPDANHFTVVDELTRPDSPMLQRIVAMARATAAA
jgi:arylformamidase